MDKLTRDLLNDGHITREQIDIASEDSDEDSIVVENLVENGNIHQKFLNEYIAEKIHDGIYKINIIKPYAFLQESAILEIVAKKMKLKFIDLDSIDLDYKLIDKIPINQLERNNAIIVEESDLNIQVAFADPLNVNAQNAIQRLFPRKPIQIAVATNRQINNYIFKVGLKDSVKELVGAIKEELDSIGTIEEQQEASSVLKLIDVILKSCIRSRGSDIHLEPTEKNCVIRARIDGKLTEMFILDKEIYPPLTSRLKLLSNLDIAEKRKPQDGRFSALIDEDEFDFRISTLPILYGESTVMRILDKKKALVKLVEAGMDKVNYTKLATSLKSPFGIILVTGPTGSGKTTTLYGALNEIRSTEDKIITVEDPVEYRMNLIQQVQVNPKVGLSFASALRSILRQDPDKIMIGEIRDHETLEIAIKAALTGHLVLSTLHTNDSLSAISRMSDMGIESYLISGAVVAIQAQRLVRKTCENCKELDNIPKSILHKIEHLIPPNTKFYKGVGCKRCNGTGYSGREMICEVLTVSDTLSKMIAMSESKDALEKQALEDGFIPMFNNGIDKAVSGVTSVDEVFRIIK
ncbi:MAG: GspE/PulE family protein [Campylobacterota bacterium]|nr:GspE/PulE family protein [Campylobacterota bacterium]